MRIPFNEELQRDFKDCPPAVSAAGGGRTIERTPYQSWRRQRHRAILRRACKRMQRPYLSGQGQLEDRATITWTCCAEAAVVPYSTPFSAITPPDGPHAPVSQLKR